jgi:hypothetical protein
VTILAATHRAGLLGLADLRIELGEERGERS